MKVRLTVVDTPGYGGGLDSTQEYVFVCIIYIANFHYMFSIAPIVKYVDEQYERYYRDESGLNRRNITDTRVHCCLYFISPFGYGLRPIDKEFIRQLQHKVNIVPVIGRSDVLKRDELARMKQRITEQLQNSDLKVFTIPEAELEEDIGFKQQCDRLKKAMPLAVCGSNSIVEVKGKKIRGRTMPWGIVEIENPDHCDFIWLKTLLTTHMNDLRETTHEILYESYRAQRLLSSTGSQIAPSPVVATHDSTEKERELAEREKRLLERERQLMQQMQKQQIPNSVV